MPLPRPTAKRKLLPTAPVNPAAQQRLRQGQQRVAARSGFAAHVRAVPRRPAAAMAPLAAAALLGSAGGVGLFIGWLQGSWAIAGGSLAAAGLGAWLGLKARATAAPPNLPGTASVDEADAERLDALVEACAGELPAGALARLEGIAATLGRMVPTLRQGLPGPPWRPDDGLFLRQLLKRYLPDSIQRYLEIPAAQRPALRLDDGRTPAEALEAQLDGLAGELAERETRLAQAASEALALHGAFLEARRKG